MKRKLDKALAVIFVLLLLPYVVTILMNGKSAQVRGTSSPLYVEVKSGNVGKKVLWEEYFVGLLAKEIDVTYGDEALKAQAILTRTNLYRKIEKEKKAVFTESYMTYPEMKEVWGETDAEKIYKRLKKISRETEGKVLMYEGKTASASFHSLSNGRTRNGEEVLGGGNYPYLQMKDCPKDIEAPLQLQTLRLTYDEVKEYCRPFLAAVEEKEAKKAFTFADFEIKALDSAGYVTKIRIGGHIYPGEEFRKALYLPSSCFTLQEEEGELKITTKGVGHGLGMSQYTANEMAKDGKTYEEILQYFFEGGEIKEVVEVL